MTEAAPYKFMFKSDGTPKLPELLDFRRAVESMPEHKAMFRPTSYLERGAALHFRWEPKLLYFVGSWEVPEWFPTGGHLNSHFINPNYQGKERYAISGARCACGKVVTDLPPMTSIEETHAEGCTPADRAAVYQRIQDIRLQRVVVGAHLNQAFPEIAPSLGVSPHTLSDFVRTAGLDWGGLREIGRHRMAATIDRLRDWGYLFREIGEAFGYSSGRIRDIGNRRRLEPLNCTPESVA